MAAAEYFFYLTYQVARQRDLFFDIAMGDDGLNLTRWRTLAIIRRIDNCSMTELALYTGIDRTTLTRSVDQLVKLGLVERAAQRRDRRKVSLAISERGEALYRQASRLLVQQNRQLLEGLDPEELRVANRLLQRVLSNVIPDAVAAANLIRFGRSPEEPAA